MNIIHDPYAAVIVKIPQILPAPDTLSMSAHIKDQRYISMHAQCIQNMLITLFMLTHSMHKMDDAVNLSIRDLHNARKHQRIFI